MFKSFVAYFLTKFLTGSGLLTKHKLTISLLKTNVNGMLTSFFRFKKRTFKA